LLREPPHIFPETFSQKSHSKTTIDRMPCMGIYSDEKPSGNFKYQTERIAWYVIPDINLVLQDLDETVSFTRGYVTQCWRNVKSYICGDTQM
jgi:hypothetical protein